jgi:hypothetical protein
VTPEQKERILHRAAELELASGEYGTKVLLESLGASPDCPASTGGACRSNYFIESLVTAWLQDLLIGEELLRRFRADSEAGNQVWPRAAITRARAAAGAVRLLPLRSEA